MILTGGEQCPCGKGPVLTPRVIECGDLIDCSFDKLIIDVYLTGHPEKDDVQILRVKYKTTTKPCHLLELKIQNFVIRVENNQNGYGEVLGLTDTTDDSLEALRSHDYFSQLIFRSNKQYTDYQNMGSLRMVTESNKTEHFTDTDGYMKIKFDPCSPPKYCSRCLKKLLIDFAYNAMFKGPLECPTNNGLSTIPDLVELRYPNDPTIQHCRLSEIMVTVLPSAKNKIYTKVMKDFGGFSLNFDSIWTPCVKHLNCIGRDCSINVI